VHFDAGVAGHQAHRRKPGVQTSSSSSSPLPSRQHQISSTNSAVGLIRARGGRERIRLTTVWPADARMSSAAQQSRSSSTSSTRVMTGLGFFGDESFYNEAARRRRIVRRLCRALESRQIRNRCADRSTAAIADCAAAAWVLLWQQLRGDYQSASRASSQATSYPTRSELAHPAYVQFQSLTCLADSWMSADEANQPPAELPVEVVSLPGSRCDRLATDDGRRVARPRTTGPQKATSVDTDGLRSSRGPPRRSLRPPRRTRPFVDGEGHGIFRYYVPISEAHVVGALLAFIDSQDLLKGLLATKPSATNCGLRLRRHRTVTTRYR